MTSRCGPAPRSGARLTRRRLLATSLFGDMPLSGEVNLLTTGAFAPGDLFSGETVPRGVAYLSIGLPTAGGSWTMRAAMSEGDLSSWNVAGAYTSRPGATHSLDFGLTVQPPGIHGGQPRGAGGGRGQQPERRRGLRVRQMDRRAPAHRRLRRALRALRLPAARRPAQSAHVGVRRARAWHARSSPQSPSAWSRPAPRSSC